MFFDTVSDTVASLEQATALKVSAAVFQTALLVVTSASAINLADLTLIILPSIVISV